jgi:FkbM family methyltransferase
MTVEQKIETSGAGDGEAAPGPRGFAGFLKDIEPFFHLRPLVYVDVGAHHGDVFAKLLRSPLKVQEAHLVEPNPHAYATLERTVAAHGAGRIATCHHLALADRPGRLCLRDAGTMTKVIGAGPAEGKAFEVEARTLDDLAQSFTTPHMSLLKIDVEGYETQVLAGARRLLEAQAIDLIYIEAGLDPLGTQQTYYRAIEDLLRPHGYRLFRIYEQMHEWLEDSPLLRRANLALMSEAFAARNPYRLSRELMALREEKARLEESLAARFAEIARLTEMLEVERGAAERPEAAHDAALRAGEAELARLRSDLDAARAGQRKAEADLAAEREARRKAEQTAGEVRSTAALLAKEREASLALQRKLIGAQAGRAELGKLASAMAREREALGRQVTAAEAATRDLHAYALELEKRHAALLSSETWRATAPVRRAIDLVRGRKTAPSLTPRLTAGARKPARAPRPKDGAAEVARYVHHLWGGLSKPAVRELARLLEGAGYDGKSRFTAAHKLATWHAFQGDHDAALAAIRAIDREAPDLRDSKQRWMKEGFIQQARGDRAAARAALEHFLGTKGGRQDPDATLALASTLDDDEPRLAAVNAVFDRAGFAPIERVDPKKPLALDNIRGRDVGRRLGDLGRVSVIVPAYNGADGIATALASLRAQSYDNLEILVVDDASTDATAEVVADLAREDPRIRLIRQERNGGAYPARNRGLAEATGAFVTTHDADDWSHPQKIETQLAFLAQEPQVAGVCTHWVRVLPSLAMSSDWRLADRILRWNHGSFMFRREVLDALGPWDPVRVGADSELIWRIQAARGRGSIRGIVKDAPLTFGRDDAASLTRSADTHMRSIHFGLRQTYHAIARYSHAQAPDPAQAAELRRGAAPAALFDRNPSIALDLLLIGDCTDPVIVEEMRAFIDSRQGRGRRIGLFHWPNFAAPPAELCAGYCALVVRDGVQPVPPGARVALPQRYGIFFGNCHPEIDQFPTIEAVSDQALRGLQSRLWGGFSHSARAELEAIKDAVEARPLAAAQAAWILARWHAIGGDYARALENIVLMREADPAAASDRRQFLQEAKYLCCLGRTEEARALLAARAPDEDADPTLALARASTHAAAPGATGEPERALEHINAVYRDLGLSEIARRDPARPLSIDNLTSTPIQAASPARVSVIVPVYNAAETVRTALASLAEQSWENLEVLVVDDASTDATADAVADFARGDPRFRLIRQKTNSGSYPCRNRALLEATGDFVTVHDADDWSHPDKIRLQAESLVRGETPYNFTTWTRTRPELVFIGIAEAASSLVSLNFSSHMIPRADLRAAGGWDHIRVTGDSELIWRIEALAGRPKEAFREHLLLPDCPLSFGRLSDSSLTGSAATHGLSLYHGVRREYREAADRWHARLRAGEDRDALAEIGLPRFPAPPAIRPERPEAPPLDLLVVGDFNMIGGTLQTALTMLRAGRAAGLACGLLHYRRYDLEVTKPLVRSSRDFAYENDVRIVAPGEALRAETVVFSHPPLASHVMDRFPAIDHDHLVLVVNQMAERNVSGTDRVYDPREIRANLVELLGSEGLWVPISERVRRIMAADPRYPAPHDDIWAELIDLDVWCAGRSAWRGRERARPVLGRHGRDHPLKWPAEPQALRAAYCADRPCEVRFLGGARFARERAGSWPANWTEFAFGTRDVQEFLGDLDLFLHFPDRDYIEEYGRAPMEAMAVGVPVILPPEFEPTFGAAALYAEPEAVWERVEALWRDEAAWMAQAERGRAYVQATCGYDALPKRLARLRAAAGAERPAARQRMSPA